MKMPLTVVTVEERTPDTFLDYLLDMSSTETVVIYADDEVRPSVICIQIGNVGSPQSVKRSFFINHPSAVTRLMNLFADNEMHVEIAESIFFPEVVAS